ncbi:MAG: hypothetical protein SGI90_03070, partial [Candidatus Eisenbacteria bacterium]|nr:hypothetical protein [Candidatus Eisenbacteria bacterium]
MTSTRWVRPSAALARILPLLLSLLTTTALARETRIGPTGKPADYERVRKALSGLAPGDTLTLMRGLFDWSQNLSDSSLVARQPGGMPLPVSGIVVRGVRTQQGGLETILRGATDPAGRPVRPSRGTNAAFRNAPGGNRVTVEDLVLE